MLIRPFALSAVMESGTSGLAEVSTLPDVSTSVLEPNFSQSSPVDASLRSLVVPLAYRSTTFLADMARSFMDLPEYTPSEKSSFLSLCSKVSGGAAPVEVVADGWHHLQMTRFGDFLTGKERFGLISIKRFEEPDALLAPLGPRKARDTRLISDLIRRLKSEPHPKLALPVYEVTFNGDVVGSHTNRLLHTLSIFCDRIETALGGQVPLVRVTTQEWDGETGPQTFVTQLTVRILSPRFTQRALECLYPEKGFQFDYHYGDYDGVDLRSMRRQHILGTSLQWKTHFLRDIQALVPGWYYRLHDDYHNADQALIGPETKTALDYFSDLLVSIREKFSGKDSQLLEMMHHAVDDREAAYKYNPQQALEKIWALIPFYYLAFPILEPYWTRDPVRNAAIIPSLLQKHYQSEPWTLEKMMSLFFPRSLAANQEAYRKAVDYFLRRSRLFPNAEASLFLTDFFERAKSLIPL